MQYKYKSYNSIKHFPYLWSSSENIQISRYTLLHSFLTTGRTLWFLVYPSVPRIWRPLLYPLTIRSWGWYIGRFIWINSLLDTESRDLRLADFYNTLDQTEKAQATYTLATIITGITARIKYSIQWLLHLDIAIVNELVRLRRGRKRGDLIGFSQSQNQWFVIEAKGRQTANRSIINRAKGQVNNIAYVQDDNGIHPTIGFVSLLHASGIQLENFWIDPPIKDENILAIKLEEFFWLYYYDIARFILEEDDITTFEEYLCRKILLPNLGYIGIGLHREILIRFKKYFLKKYPEKEMLKEIYFTIKDLLNDKSIPKNYKHIDNGVIGPDAILVFGDCLKNRGETWI